MLSRHSVRLALVLSTAFAFALSAPGCALQDEGERCSLKNGNDDCGLGAQGEQLTCISASALGGQSDICCSQNSEQPACIPSASGGTTSTSSTTSASSSSGAVSGTGGMGGMAGGGGTAGAGGTGGTGG